MMVATDMRVMRVSGVVVVDIVRVGEDVKARRGVGAAVIVDGAGVDVVVVAVGADVVVGAVGDAGGVGAVESHGGWSGTDVRVSGRAGREVPWSCCAACDGPSVTARIPYVVVIIVAVAAGPFSPSLQADGAPAGSPAPGSGVESPTSTIRPRKKRTAIATSPGGRCPRADPWACSTRCARPRCRSWSLPSPGVATAGPPSSVSLPLPALLALPALPTLPALPSLPPGRPASMMSSVTLQSRHAGRGMRPAGVMALLALPATALPALPPGHLASRMIFAASPHLRSARGLQQQGVPGVVAWPAPVVPGSALPPSQGGRRASSAAAAAGAG